MGVSLTVGDNQLKVCCLIDTGSSVTLMRENVYRYLCGKLKRPVFLQPAKQLCTVTGNAIKVIGKTELKFDKCEPVEVIIVKDIIVDCILGIDFLSKARATLSIGERSVQLFGSHFKCDQRQKHRHLTAVVDSTGYPVVDEVLEENQHMFSTDEDKLGECMVEPCLIDTGDAMPIKQRPRRLPLSKRHLVEEQIKEMEEAGVIRPSSSPWASPIVLVPKKDGTTRFCIDFRAINSVTITDAYALPSIQEIFDSMDGSAIYSTLDLTSGYWQIPMEDSSIQKTAFCTHNGNWEFTRMPFGLKNAPALFQRTMNRVLTGLIGKICFVYLDDIVIFSKSPEEHARHLAMIFTRLQDANLKLKRKKCFFGLGKIELLGYTISGSGIAPQESKVSAIKQLPTPTTKTEVRSFLGMCNYYRRCIPNYAQISRPIQDLTSPKINFKWTEECGQSFDQLKKVLTSDKVMAYPKIGRPYKLYTDACDYAVGAILVQEDEEGIERPIHYVSHQLDHTQRKWATIEKEAYAVVYALQKLRPYLWGAEFVILTDHKPLKSLFLQEVKNTKIQRWAVLIAEFGAPIKYREGKNNVRADMLSRIKVKDQVATIDTYSPLYTIDEENEKVLLEADGIKMEELAALQREEFKEFYVDAEIDDTGYLLNKKDILYSNRTPYVTAEKYPRILLPQKYRHDVIQRSHEEVGHLNIEKTMRRTQDMYVWPGMKRDVREFINNCATCRVHQNRPVKTSYGEMPIANYPFEIIRIDLIGPLVQSTNGNKYALTVIDHCTGWAEAYPIPDKKGLTIQSVLKTQLFPQHSYPRIIIQDNGKEFNHSDWLLSLQKHGIEVRKTTVYHPQTNGKCERFNRTLKEMLTRLVNNDNREWENQLGPALMAYRNAVSTVTGYTPFFLLYGRQGRLPLSASFNRDSQNAFQDRLYEHDKAIAIARKMTENSRKYNRERVNAKANATDVKVGSHVVYKAPESSRLPFTSKWDPKWLVTRVRGPVIWITQQETGKQRTVNRDKVIIVDPEMSWEQVNPRPIRKTAVNRNQDRDITRMYDENILRKQKQRGLTHEKQQMQIRRGLRDKPHTTQDNAQPTQERQSSNEPEPMDESENSTPMPEQMEMSDEEDERMETEPEERRRRYPKRHYPASPPNVRRSTRIAEKKRRVESCSTICCGHYSLQC